MKSKPQAKTERIQYLYPYKRFQIMVGHVDIVKSNDYYYLNKWETLKYLLTGHLPHESIGGKWVKKMNRGDNHD